MVQQGSLRLPSPPALALYAATVLAEIPVLFMRIAIATAVAAIVLLAKGHPAAGAEGLSRLAVIPTVWSIIALLTPIGGGWWWRQNMGGRHPSTREQTAYTDAVQTLQAAAALPLRIPSGWFVIDTPQPDAAVCGQTLMLSRGLLESEYLPAVLAHELGHLATSDGNLTAAVNRLIINPPPRTRERDQAPEREMRIIIAGPLMIALTIMRLAEWLVRKSIRFAQGGLALRILAPFWGTYWREREYTADQYAAALGQADELADFLEVHALIHDHPVPFLWLTEHTHPPSELRIDRLRNAQSSYQAVAPWPGPVKAAPTGPPTAGPDGPTLTEPTHSANRPITSAGKTPPPHPNTHE